MYISKIDNLSRLILLNTAYRKNNSIIVTEYPKSGGSWLGNMISQYLNFEYPRDNYATLAPSVVHGHYLPKYGIGSFPKIVVLRRDPRDVMVSYYFHLNFLHESGRNKKEYKEYSTRLNFKEPNDVILNLPHFIEFLRHYTPKKWVNFFHPSTWSHFYGSWSEVPHVIHTSYEALLNDTPNEVKHILNKLEISDLDEVRLGDIIQRNSFENQANRNKGTEDRNSFLRKGIVGDWKNYFSEEAKDVFKKYYQKDLEKFKYEQNQDW